MLDARRDRHRGQEQSLDYYSARIVAMISATHSKHGRYEPVKYMLDGRRLMREQAERKAKALTPMTGEEIMARFRALGVPVIDKRKRI